MESVGRLPPGMFLSPAEVAHGGGQPHRGQLGHVVHDQPAHGQLPALGQLYRLLSPAEVVHGGGQPALGQARLQLPQHLLH